MTTTLQIAPSPAMVIPLGLIPDATLMDAATAIGTLPAVDTYTTIGPPALDRKDGGGDDDGGQLLELRDYQHAQIQSVVESIQKGDDRGILRAPMQTGKSLIIGPLAGMALSRLFPEKDILVISPYQIITRQVLGDLQVTMHGVDVGIIDATHKDFSGDHKVVVASAFTIGTDENLEKIDPNRFGLVIVDEATFTMASTWQRILRRFGFLDETGKILRADGKYLLGLTADPYSLQGIFGTGARIHSLGFRWFMEHGYLHHIKGLQVSYEPNVRLRVRAAANDGFLLEPRSSAMQSAAVVKTYETYLNGKKAIVFTSSIEHARNHEAAFNQRFGDGHAVAVYANMPPGKFQKAIAAFEKKDAKVIISIGMLAYGYRASGAEGVIHDHQTMSARRFGQRIGRPLGVRDGEAQRTVLNIDLIGHGTRYGKFVTLASFFGLQDRVQTGIEYDPLTIKIPSGSGTKKGGPKRVFVPHAVKVYGMSFSFSEHPSEYEFQEGRLQGHLKQALETKFGRDITAMADAFSLDTEKLYRFLYGELPKTRAEVRNIAKGIGMRDEKLVGLWEADALDAMEYMYPTSQHSDVTRDLIMFVRLATIRVGGLGSTQSTVASIMGGASTQLTDYQQWQTLLSGKLYIGKQPLNLHAIRRVFTAAENQTGIPMEKVEAVMAAFREELDIGEILEISSGDMFFTPDEDMESQHETAERHDMARIIRSFLVMFRPHEEIVFRLFLGIGYDRAYSPGEIAERFNSSQGYIKTVIKNATWRFFGRLDKWHEGYFPKAAKLNAYLEWREHQVARIESMVHSLRRGRIFGSGRRERERDIERDLRLEFDSVSVGRL